MKTKFLILYLLIFQTILVFGQVDTLNQFDSNKKKHGKWIEYLDNKWFTVNDSNKATFYRYNYFDHGVNINTEMNQENYKLICGDSIVINRKLTLLDGEYKWYDKNSNLISESLYKKGNIVWAKSYNWGITNKYLTGKKMHELYDFNIKYNGQPFSFYCELYDKDGNIQKGYMRKGEKGWAFYLEK